MNLIEDILYTNKNIIIKSLKSAMKNWKIFLVGIAYGLASIIMWRIAANAWILSGILIAIFQSAIISNYLYLIENIISYDKFTIEDFKAGFTVYLRKIYMIVILFWFARFGVSLFLRPIFYIRIGPISLWLLIQIIVFILLNSLPETIYQKHYYGFDIITYTFEFIKDNAIEWFIPNVLIFIFGYVVHIIINAFILNFFTFNYLISLIIRMGIYSILYQLILSFAMIYRGHLFNLLSTSSRRKRIFMRNMYK